MKDSIVSHVVRAQQRALASSALVLVLLGGALAAHDATTREDDEMLGIARVFAAEVDEDSVEHNRHAVLDELEEQAGFPGVIEVWSNEERLGGNAAGLLGRDSVLSNQCSFISLRTGVHRVCALADHEITVVIGEPAFTALQRVLYALAATTLLALLVTLIGAWRGRSTVLRALAPLSDFTARVATAKAGDSAQLLGPWEVHEVDALASTVTSLLARIDEARERERRFAVDASHELRSPLARLRGELELALQDVNEGPVHARLMRASSTCARLIRDTESLLALSRSETSEGIAVDVGESVRHVLNALHERDDKTHARVNLQCDDEALVRADPALIELMAANLIENALKFSSGPVRVDVKAREGSVVLEVHDEGTSLSASEAERAFEPFFRGEHARAEKAGTGLGLALVLHASRALGGTATLARSEHGTTATVHLPPFGASSATM